MEKHVYEEYNSEKNLRFRIFEVNGNYRIQVEQYQEESDFMGYIHPAGFYRTSDVMVYIADSIDSGISIGRELMRNII